MALMLVIPIFMWVALPSYNCMCPETVELMQSLTVSFYNKTFF